MKIPNIASQSLNYSNFLEFMPGVAVMTGACLTSSAIQGISDFSSGMISPTMASISLSAAGIGMVGISGRNIMNSIQQIRTSGSVENTQSNSKLYNMTAFSAGLAMLIGAGVHTLGM